MAACMKMETLQKSESENAFVAEVIPAIMINEDEVNTKTYIDEHDNYSSGVGTMWNAKEQIGVYSNYSKNVKYTSTNKSGSGDITFSGVCLGTPNYAYYPYSTDNNNNAEGYNHNNCLHKVRSTFCKESAKDCI